MINMYLKDQTILVIKNVYIYSYLPLIVPGYFVRSIILISKVSQASLGVDLTGSQVTVTSPLRPLSASVTTMLSYTTLPNLAVSTTLNK